MSNVEIEFESCPGDTIEKVAIDLVNLANSSGKSASTCFNEIIVTAWPGNIMGELVEFFHRSYILKYELYERSKNCPPAKRYRRQGK